MLRLNPACAVQFQPLREFALGKRHAVSKLRARVANHITGSFSPEDMVNFVLTCTQQQLAGAWLDRWNPAALLRHCGFQYLTQSTHVEAIGANEYGTPLDTVVSFTTHEGLQQHPHINGTVSLQHLREELRSVLATCGNMHWATATDVVALGESLGLGFLILSDTPQGAGSHIYSLNQRRADYDWWVLLYCAQNVHYQLAALRLGPPSAAASFFHVSEMPLPLRDAFNSANRNCPIGHTYVGGVA